MDNDAYVRTMTPMEPWDQLGVLSCVLLNIRGGVIKQAEFCLTETWLAADDKPDVFPHSSTGAGAGNGCGRTGCAHRRTENLGMSCLGAAGRRDVQP